MAEPESEHEPRIFTLSEAERTRRELEPVLIDAISFRQRLAELDGDLGQTASRILLMGGMQVPYEKLARARAERERTAQTLREAIERIEASGCVVKDLDVGLLDFPAMVNNEEVYLCWRLGEDRIRFWHRQDEGFAGRKPIDPRDPGPANPIQ